MRRLDAPGDLSLSFEIRPELPGDHGAIRSLLDKAFGQPDEGQLVDALRAGHHHVSDLCLVAVRDEEPIGHVFFSEAGLGPADHAVEGTTVLALAPMAVAPERQRLGIGTALLEESLRRAEGAGYPLVVVLGHPEYYPRFGFEPAAPLGIEFPGEVPPEAWMALRLPDYTAGARGTVSYAPPFGLG